jgi:hypothetical protein
MLSDGACLLAKSENADIAGNENTLGRVRLQSSSAILGRPSLLCVFEQISTLARAETFQVPTIVAAQVRGAEFFKTYIKTPLPAFSPSFLPILYEADGPTTLGLYWCRQRLLCSG